MDIFKAQTIIEIFNTLSVLKNDSLSNTQANKMLYAIDKYYLQKYGCTFTNDEYIASGGPEPVTATKIFKRQLDQFPTIIADKFDQTLMITQSGVKSKTEPNIPFMGNRLYQIIKHVHNKLGNLNDQEIDNWSHQFVEWTKNEKDAKKGKYNKIDINDFFEVAPDDKNVFLNDVNHLKLSKQFYNGEF